MDKVCRRNAIVEHQILCENSYFFGRTDFDKSHVLMRNPNATYFVGEELLRSVFYANEGTWDINKIERHSIFMPSGFNPIKGMHLAIQAVGILKKFFSKIKLYIPGIFASEKGKKRCLIS